MNFVNLVNFAWGLCRDFLNVLSFLCSHQKLIDKKGKWDILGSEGGPGQSRDEVHNVHDVHAPNLDDTQPVRSFSHNRLPIFKAQYGSHFDEISHPELRVGRLPDNRLGPPDASSGGARVTCNRKSTAASDNPLCSTTGFSLSLRTPKVAGGFTEFQAVAGRRSCFKRLQAVSICCNPVCLNLRGHSRKSSIRRPLLPCAIPLSIVERMMTVRSSGIGKRGMRFSVVLSPPTLGAGGWSFARVPTQIEGHSTR
jgi:hypothetical protein